jgi:alpha-tubulin suppressor-like RCC1 family protein
MRVRSKIARAVALAVCLFTVGLVNDGAPRASAEPNEQPGALVQASIAAGGSQVCVIVNGGTVRCWGRNDDGELGLGNTNRIGDNETVTAANATVNLSGATAISLTAGDYHTCALLAGGAVRCWGQNTVGQLGLGNTNTVGDNESPIANVNLGGAAIAIAAGSFHTCALMSGGTVRCWGFNLYGQLGLGNQNNIGDNETVTAANSTVNLGSPAISITAGSTHTCAVLSSGAVRCWGGNEIGQLGLGNTSPIGDDEPLTAANSTVNLGASAYTVSAGFQHTCALLVPTNGSAGLNVRCWGNNGNGQLGLGNRTTIGDNESPTANVNLGENVYALSASGQHTCVRFAASTLRCWGWNTNGQLGIGNTSNVGDDEDPTVNVNLGTATAAAVTLGYAFSCAVLTGSGAVRCWGSNESGELGLGDVGPRSTGLASVSNFFVGPDNINPSIALSSPTPNQAFPGKPLAIGGTIFDNRGSVSAFVVIYRPIGAGQYWNGSTWQTEYTTISAPIVAVVPSGFVWAYTFNPPQSGGNYFVTAMALDAANNYTFTPFTPFSLPDTIAPNATLTPNTGATTSGPITVGGTATDNSSLWGTYVAIYQYATGKYWNGTGWQTAFTSVPANLTTPGSTSSTYTYNFTPPTPGYYLIGALPIDSNYNYTFVAWNTFNAV